MTRRHGWPRALFAFVGRLVVARLALAAGLVLTGVAASAQPSPQIRAEIDRIQADSSYQLRFETPPPQEPASPPPAWLRDILDWLGGNGDWLVRGLSFVLIALAVVAVLYMTVPAVRDPIDAIRARFRRVRDDGDAGDDHWSPDATAARNLLAEADTLATQGRFAEAVHLLLGRSVEDIARRRPDALAPALTARAIARLADIPAPARQAFGQIGDVVERAIWARRAIARPDWDDARAAYQQFALGDHWRRAA